MKTSGTDAKLQKNFFSQVLTSALPLPTCKNLALYEALKRGNSPNVHFLQ